ncbi:MAG: ferrochelatase [Chloroflexi bacterium]|nr:ferrochelatase [Chloroflexota bacterium]
MNYIGVLVMAYGGPSKLEDVESYLKDVRGGRPTSPEVLEEMTERYRKIGGISPILANTQAQAAALEAVLYRKSKRAEPAFKTIAGMRHWRPYISEALAEMEGFGIRQAVGLVMAPHYSRMSVGMYYQRAEEVHSSIEIARIESWHLLPGYLDALTTRVKAGLEKFPSDVRSEVPIIFTAHSLPERILALGDPYRDQLMETVNAVMERLGPRPHEFAFQSAAMTPDPWLGPDAGEVIQKLAGQGQKNVLIAPIGFVTEHVEILYDVDIEYRQQAEKLGMRFERIELVNAAPEMIDSLAGLVRQKAQEAGWL